MNDMRKINIAIDGPAGAGKSTVARLLAVKLGYVYVDTGAMYRVVALRVLEEGLDPADETMVTRLASSLRISFEPGTEKQQVRVDDRNVTEQIRSSDVTALVSRIAKIAGVRKLLVDIQKMMALPKGVVMDGRDIGTQVLPDAEVKVFLTASVATRAKRRFEELPPGETTMAELMANIEQRDETDRNRPVSPLVVAEDAVVVDSTELSVAEVVERILALCRNI